MSVSCRGLLTGYLGRYNRIGRGFPDISAVGAFWLDFVANEEVGFGGTSMATPIVASIINRVSGPAAFFESETDVIRLSRSE